MSKVQVSAAHGRPLASPRVALLEVAPRPDVAALATLVRAVSAEHADVPGQDAPVVTPHAQHPARRVAASIAAFDAGRWAEARGLMAAETSPAAGSWAAWSAFLLRAAGWPDQAIKVADTAIAAAGRDGEAAAPWRMARAAALLDVGRTTEARLEALALSGIGGPSAPSRLWDLTCAEVLVMAAVHDGDAAAVAARAGDARRMASSVVPRVRAMGAWLAAVIADSQGDADVTSGALGAITVPPAGRTARYAGMALRTGRRDLAATAATAAERYAALNPEYPLLRAEALHARGLVDCAAPPVARAARILSGLGLPLARAAALQDAARLSGGCDSA